MSPNFSFRINPNSRWNVRQLVNALDKCQVKMNNNETFSFTWPGVPSFHINFDSEQRFATFYMESIKSVLRYRYVVKVINVLKRAALMGGSDHWDNDDENNTDGYFVHKCETYEHT